MSNIPIKRIISPDSLEQFLNSPTHAEIVAFIETLNAACTNVELTAPCPQSAVIDSLLAILDSIVKLTEETPAVDNKMSRFGNPAFKTLYDKILAASPELHAGIPGLAQEKIPELSVYFTECWGNRTRIDYGSGMELNFLCWMMCLVKLGLFKEEDYTALVTKVFWKYMEVMRVIQSNYWLEPAGQLIHLRLCYCSCCCVGSHGVWGLDDYHFLPFLFGAAQLKGRGKTSVATFSQLSRFLACTGHKHITPKSIHNADILNEFSKDYMYLACIKFINGVSLSSSSIDTNDILL